MPSTNCWSVSIVAGIGAIGAELDDVKGMVNENWMEEVLPQY